MTYWYVDLENVHDRLENLVACVRRYDRVVMAYSKAHGTVSAKCLEALDKKRVKVIYLECLCGHDNAMDFQICMEVAKNCITGAGTAHIVYSDDKGYDLPMQAWRHKGYECSTMHTYVQAEETAPTPLKASESLSRKIAHHIPAKHCTLVERALLMCGGDKAVYNQLLKKALPKNIALADRYYYATRHLLTEV